MKIFRELTFEGTPENLVGSLDSVESAFCDGWRRDEQLEERILERDSGQRAFRDRAYFCPRSDRHAAAHLWIMARNENSLYVSNIMPVDSDRLTYNEYNAILEEFHDRFATDAAAEHDVTLQLGSDQMSLEEILPERASDALKDFCEKAYRNAGLSIPDDEERWQEFIIAAHDSNCDLSGTTLRRWLVEDERWPEVFVGKLISEYETGRALLARAYQATA